MKQFLLFSLMCSMSGFWSCSSDPSVNPPLPPVEPVDITLSGTLALPSELGAVWGNASAMGLYCDQAVENQNTGVVNYMAVLMDGVGTSSAKFTSKLTQSTGTHLFYAYAPYSTTAGHAASALQGELPAVQTQGADAVQSVLKSSLLWASASVDAGGEAKGPEFQFRNLFGVIKFKIGSDGSFGDQVVKSVSLDAGKGAVLAGTVTVDLTAAEPSPVFGADVGPKIDLALTANNVFGAGKNVEAWMVVNPADYTGRKLAVSVMVGEDELSFEVEGMKIGANEVVQVDLECEDPNLVDLNRDGKYANCYIVSEPNTVYKFDAKVQGNGKTTPGIPAPATLDPKKVFVVWETGSELGGVISNVELSNEGIVTFTTAGTVNGNALIAVTDGKITPNEPQGAILWSWHIWATDYAESGDKRCVNFEKQEYMLMDRDLGDWVQPAGTDSYFRGLKYQWGRKDPFFGLNSSGEVVTGACVMTDPENYGFGAASVFDADPAPTTPEETMDLAIMYPFYFLKGASALNYDWYGVASDVEGRNDNLWGNADGNPVKTIYDPCPVGYMVAPIEAFTGFSKTGFSSITISKSNMNVSGVWNEGWNFITNEPDYSFFKAGGTMTFSSGVLSIVSGPGGASGYYWTTSSPKTQQMRSISFDKDVMRQNTVNRAAGESVRCVREK